jgi:hypothetical protein
MVPHAYHVVGSISALEHHFDATLDSTEPSSPKTDYIYPPLAISRGDDRDTRKTPYRSKDCKDRRGDAAGATPGCPFASINTISISNMMKTDPLDMAIMEVTCIKLSLVLHRLESHELSIMIVTIFCITYVVDLMFVRLFMRYKDIYFLDV